MIRYTSISDVIHIGYLNVLVPTVTYETKTENISYSPTGSISPSSTLHNLTWFPKSDRSLGLILLITYSRPVDVGVFNVNMTAT